MDDLLQEFIAETRETLEALAGEIVAWEAAPDDRARLDAIFRFVHTVKGSCGFLDLPRLQRLSHAAEDVLAAVRAGERRPDTALVNAVLAIVDRIGEIVEAIAAGAGLDDSGEDLLIAALAEGAAEAAPAPAPTPGAAAPQRAQSRSVRLNVDLLDRMMSGMSDMVLARNDLARRLRHEATDPAVEAALERLSTTVADMRDTVTRTRMQKIDALFSALPRMVRDTAAEVGKAVTLHVDGADVELDREMIEMLRDPLVHIVRNAIDHGIEPAAQRRSAGKRETGSLTVSARQSGNQIIVEVRDDGRGIDVQRLLAKVAATGRSSEHELRQLSPRAQLELIFEPGLSTADTVTAISGRGVGMDVVRANVEQIGGRVDLANDPGRGLLVAIHVPLTLSIISTIGVGVGAQRFAVPRQSIEEIVRTGAPGVRIDVLGDTPFAAVRDRRMPLVDLHPLLGLGEGAGDPAMLMIVSAAGGSFALGVDAVLDTEELVIKPAAPAVMAAGVFAGQTLPDSGLPMLLLDCAGIAARANLSFTRQAEEAIVAAVEERPDALLFRDLDGARRLVPLAAVERVQPLEPGAVRVSAGGPRLVLDDHLVDVVAIGPVDGRGRQVLRLRDGAAELAYVIAEALDIVPLPEVSAVAPMPGPVLGAGLLDGEPIELLDLHWLFARGQSAPLDHRPLCILQGSETEWMTLFLKPVVEAAGYRVALAAPAGETPIATLAMAGDPVAAATGTVVRLARTVGEPGTVYRYDRATLIDELKRAEGRR